MLLNINVPSLSTKPSCRYEEGRVWKNDPRITACGFIAPQLHKLSHWGYITHFSFIKEYHLLLTHLSFTIEIYQYWQKVCPPEKLYNSLITKVLHKVKGKIAFLIQTGKSYELFMHLGLCLAMWSFKKQAKLWKISIFKNANVCRRSIWTAQIRRSSGTNFIFNSWAASELTEKLKVIFMSRLIHYSSGKTSRRKKIFWCTCA